MKFTCGMSVVERGEDYSGLKAVVKETLSDLNISTYRYV
jgi:hypothetical protein